MATDAGGSAGNLGGALPPAAAPVPQPQTNPLLGAPPAAAGFTPPNFDTAPPGAGGTNFAPAGVPGGVAQVPAYDPAAANVSAGQRLATSTNPMTSDRQRETNQIDARMGVVNGINSGQMDYTQAVRGGMAPAQATAMGLMAPYPQVTAPNMAYGGPQPGPTFTGFAPTMAPQDAQAILAAGGRGNAPAAGPARAPMQPGQRTDESADQFSQRQKDIASSNIANADIGSRQARARQAKSLLSSQARQVAKSGDAKSAAALFSQAAGMETPKRETPYSVARTREDDATKRTVGKDGDSAKLQVSRDTTERERMRQEGLNQRSERKQTFDQTMADNKARLVNVGEANKQRATGLIKQIETIGRQIQKQEEYVGGDKGKEAEGRIKTLEGNRDRVQKDLDKIFGEQGNQGTSFTTEAAAVAAKLPKGTRITINGRPAIVE